MSKTERIEIRDEAEEIQKDWVIFLGSSSYGVVESGLYLVFWSTYPDVPCTCWCVLGRVRLFVTPWTIAGQTSLSMEFFQARILEWVAISSSRDANCMGTHNLDQSSLQRLENEHEKLSWGLRDKMPRKQIEIRMVFTVIRGCPSHNTLSQKCVDPLWGW